MVSFHLPPNNWLVVQPPYIATPSLGLVAVYYQVHTDPTVQMFLATDKDMWLDAGWVAGSLVPGITKEVPCTWS